MSRARRASEASAAGESEELARLRRESPQLSVPPAGAEEPEEEGRAEACCDGEGAGAVVAQQGDDGGFADDGPDEGGQAKPRIKAQVISQVMEPAIDSACSTAWIICQAFRGEHDLDPATRRIRGAVVWRGDGARGATRMGTPRQGQPTFRVSAAVWSVPPVWNCRNNRQFPEVGSSALKDSSGPPWSPLTLVVG